MANNTNRANWVVNQEQVETPLNRSGLKSEPRNNISPWSTGKGPCKEAESLNIHGSLSRPGKGRY
jgi:hypothetical protein